MRIIPAIDILNGTCVRLTQGDFTKVKIYNNDPVSVANQFQVAGFKYLHLVDLDGAKNGSVVNWDIIRRLKEETDLVIDFGGGVKTDSDVDRLLNLGINLINVGSLAVKEPEKFANWFKMYGPEKFILSADVTNENVMINGWTDSSTLNLLELIDQYIEHGLSYLTCTDISRDGMLAGPNIELYKKLKSRFPTLDITASGGISTLNDLQNLESISINGAIIGKALYEKRIQFDDLKI